MAVQVNLDPNTGHITATGSATEIDDIIAALNANRDTLRIVRLKQTIDALDTDSKYDDISHAMEMLAQIVEDEVGDTDVWVLAMSKLYDRLKWPMAAVQYGIALAQDRLNIPRDDA